MFGYSWSLAECGQRVASLDDTDTNQCTILVSKNSCKLHCIKIF
jgi:hypothetical protein